MKLIATAAAALLISTAAHATPVLWSDGCLAVPVRDTGGAILYWNAPRGDTCWVAPEDGFDSEADNG